MLTRLTDNRRGLFAAALALAATGAAAPLGAQSIQTVDPNQAINSDIAPPPQDAPPPLAPAPSPGFQDPGVAPDAAPPPVYPAPPPDYSAPADPLPPVPAPQAAPADSSPTYHEDDLIGAAEGVFGKGAKGLATMIEGILKKQGEPNGYIVGREAGGAFGIGVRYGSGTLYHKVEGKMPIYWTGPSIGFDAGANAASTFVLVYNVYDTKELYERFPSGEGDAYVVGGLTSSYLRKGDIVLIPIRVGAGLRLGVNAGYLKFSKHQRWVPF
jgi:hypothetical protein